MDAADANFSKTFDTVSLNILVSKFGHHSLHGWTSRWGKHQLDEWAGRVVVAKVSHPAWRPVKVEQHRGLSWARCSS